MIACPSCGHENDESYIVCEKCERMLRPDEGGSGKKALVRTLQENSLPFVLVAVALVALVVWLILR